MNEFQELKSILLRVLKQDVDVNEKSSIRNLPGMDSLKLINFIVSVEKHFKVKFNTRFILELKDFESLISKIRELQ